jgi:hypothetical protein
MKNKYSIDGNKTTIYITQKDSNTYEVYISTIDLPFSSDARN